MAVREDTLNVELARLLREREDLDARAEAGAGGKWLDVDVNVDGLHVAIEAKLDFKKRPQARKAADSRLKNLRNVAVALCYPKGATEASLPGDTLTWQIRTRRSDADDWQTGTVAQLAAAVRAAPASIEDVDKVAQILSDGLDAAVQRLKTPARIELAKALDLPRSKERGGDGYFTPAKRGMLVVATAMLFHHRLQEHLPPVRPAGYDGPWSPSSPVQCAAEPGTTVGEFLEAWRAILAVDYRPVFETARVALAALPATPDIAQAVYALAGEVARIAGLVHGLRHDLLGRIFHRVLDTARYDGSFYTSTPAAVLLAALAIRKEDCDWSDPNAIERLRICDPACGTGTLLMAAAERIRDLRQRTGPLDDKDEEALALCLVEDVLWGYDINLTATHMAASTLGMLSPSTKFGRMNVHRTLLGVYEGTPYLGSLEFLTGQPRLAGWPSISQQVDDDGGEPPEQPPKMDLVIMNPPFTRDSLRHDQFSRPDELALKQREQDIFEGHHGRDATHLSGSSTGFCVLAEDMLNAGNGTLAVVLPGTVPTGPSGLGLRQFLADRFYVDSIISSHDPERINMSDNTNIGEVLIVGRRWTSAKPKPPTRVVNLIENPATALNALSTATQIEQGDGRFVIQYVDAERIESGDWQAVNFLAPHLVTESQALWDGTTQADSKFVNMSRIADVGPGGQRIRDAYTRSDVPTVSGRRAFWYHKTDVTQSMSARTDSYIEPKQEKQGLADKYWSQRSRFLLSHRLWLPLVRVAAVIVNEQAVGSRWTPCRPRDGEPQTQAALCAWLNSSPGLLAILGGRDNRKPSYPQFSLDTLRAIPVPNFLALGDDVRDALAGTYEELKDEALLPFPQMDEDPVRRRLDAAVTEALGLDAEWVAQVRRALGEEPSVTNRRYGSVGG